MLHLILFSIKNYQKISVYVEACVCVRARAHINI